MPASPPVLRAVLLGASNLRSGFPLVVDHLRKRAGGPVEILAACGHGRSYGTWSRFLYIRHLPGITGCGLWRDLEALPSLPTVALLTDIGNDLVYGASIEEVAGWVEMSLKRLAAQRATVVLTLLPLDRLERLSPLGFRVARGVLFPGRSTTLPAILTDARALNDRLRELGGRYGAHLVEPEADWYGLDPIHIRRGRRQEAWQRILSPWTLAETGALPAGRCRLPLFGAERTRLGGWERRSQQPAVSWEDGGTLRLY